MSVASGPHSIHIRIAAPVLLPYRSDRHLIDNPFDDAPFEFPAGRCSGSPVLLSGKLFAGFLKEAGGRFAYDGSNNLTIDIPEGQALFIEESEGPQASWGEYNRLVAADLPMPAASPLTALPEYRTWVEQRYSGEFGGPAQANNVPFIRDYAERILAMGLPPGKLVIDAGWCFPHAFGDWEEDACQFPDMPVLLEFLQGKGFTPGLWFAPPLISPLSRIARQRPEITGAATGCFAEELESPPFLRAVAGESLKEHFKTVFARFLEMGVRKFAFDGFYGPRKEMQAILRSACEAVIEQNADAEVDAHFPDIFASCSCHSVRASDTLRETESLDLCGTRWRVARLSAPGKTFYLDPVGGNGRDITEAAYRAYIELYHREPGMPVVSLLPDWFGEETAGMLRKLMEEKQAGLYA
ncbi:MAG: hypothetical protein IT210_13855 [Armatimonadetes bacterium]|nr:hypothetical protein [Armatimonadota bacterium]